MDTSCVISYEANVSLRMTDTHALRGGACVQLTMTAIMANAHNAYNEAHHRRLCCAGDVSNVRYYTYTNSPLQIVFSWLGITHTNENIDN